MIISPNTEHIAHTHQLQITNGYELQYYSRCSHFTRFQKKIYCPIQVTLPSDTNVLTIMDIILHIIDYCPGIQHHRISDTQKYNLRMKRENDTLKVIGSYIDIYQFLKSPFGYQILTSIFNDNFDIEETDTKITLNEQEFNNVTTPISRDEQLSHSICPICLDTMTDCNVNEIVKTSCGHHFHRNCLHKWLTADCHQPNCPMCRHSFKKII